MTDAAPPSAPSRARRAAPWLVVLLLGLVTQGLADAPTWWAGGGDHAKYLALGRAAPSHVLYDGHRYVIHPPVHGWLIGLLGVALPLEAAGQALSGLATVGLGLVVFALARRLGADAHGGTDDAAGLLAAVVFFAARGATTLGQGVTREPLQALVLTGLLAVLLLGERPARVRLAAGALGALAGLTWDLLVLAAPPLLATGRWLRRPGFAVAAAALVVAWLGWATTRAAWLSSSPGGYPAGIDGTVEAPAASPGAFFNPNLLPRTRAHNAVFWPLAPTPERPLTLLAPWPIAATREPHRGASALAVAALLAAAAAGLARRRSAVDLRRLVALLAVAAPVAAPALLGQQPRYAYPLLPGLCVAAGLGLAGLDARARRLAPAAAAALALGWAATHPHLAWARQPAFEGGGLEALGLPPGEPLAAPVGLVPDLVWRLPGRRVVTLPLTDDVEPFLAARGVRLVVVPHELARPQDAPPGWEAASGVPALAAVRAAAGAGRATLLGTVVEGEVTDAPRVRRWDLLWLGPGAPAPFGRFVEPGVSETR